MGGKTHTTENITSLWLGSVSPHFGLEGQRAYCRAMSALGHKQTLRFASSMSALRSKADISNEISMSAKCHKRT